MEFIKVLVVDDSSFMRKLIPQILEEDNEIKVIGTARDGIEAIKKLEQLKPDVITLDVEMPGMDGLETLNKIMNDNPTPVIMLSAYTPKGAEITLKALEYGAVDFVRKPSGEISLDIKKVQQELIEKIKIAKTIDLSKLKFLTKKEISI
ncbi:MAG: response regulator, partial [Candidatus Goldbacteria bacterium]|nr:response regulator [Candidatus Goldiibacteriota bacterium]